MIRDKKGQQTIWITSSIIVGLFVVGVVVFSLLEGDFSTGFDKTLETVNMIFEPIFGSLLGIDDGTSADQSFLIILAFILTVIVIVSTMDSISLFGEGKQSLVFNFLIGIIVALIGVRFMPDNLWSQLTAPSSALVAVMLLGLPFAAFFFMTIKFKKPVVIKLFWLSYLTLIAYVMAIQFNSGYFTGGDTASSTATIIIFSLFGLASAVMLFFDSTVRKLFYSQRSDTETENIIGQQNLVARQKLRAEIDKIQQILADPNSPPADIDAAKKRMVVLKRKYKGLEIHHSKV